MASINSGWLRSARTLYVASPAYSMANSASNLPEPSHYDFGPAHPQIDILKEKIGSNWTADSVVMRPIVFGSAPLIASWPYSVDCPLRPIFSARGNSPNICRFRMSKQDAERLVRSLQDGQRPIRDARFEGWRTGLQNGGVLAAVSSAVFVSLGFLLAGIPGAVVGVYLAIGVGIITGLVSGHLQRAALEQAAPIEDFILRVFQLWIIALELRSNTQVAINMPFGNNRNLFFVTRTEYVGRESFIRLACSYSLGN